MNSTILQRIRAWCATQERNEPETAQKLLKLGVNPDDIPRVLDNLKEEGFLNQGRYAGLYAGTISNLVEKEAGRNHSDTILRKLCAKGFEEELVRELIDHFGI